MTLKGEVIKVYADKQTWAAILLRDSQGFTFHASGKIYSPIVGTEIELEGEIENDKKYGPQFKAISSKTSEVMTEEGVINYLSSGFISGVGRKMAVLIAARFKESTIKIIETDPMRLTEISGIGAKKAQEIADSHKKNKSFLDLVNLLKDKVTEYQIRTIYDYYKERSVEVIKKNPYQLIYDIDGFGFQKADNIAQASGIALDDPRRTAAAITYVLDQMAKDGHCFCHIDSLHSEVKNKIKDIATEDIAGAIGKEIDNGNLILEEYRLYTSKNYFNETKAAKYTACLTKENPVRNISKYQIERAFEKIERDAGYSLEKRQKDAIKTSLNNRISVITGGPGTGKTTIIKTLLAAWNDNLHVFLSAPTGKAAQRISEAIDNQLKASTVHRLLIDWKSRPESFYNSLIIVDEASMLDLNLARPLLKVALESNSNIVFIGDTYQLPPIGPGLFFRDLVLSPCIPTTTLELSHRQFGKIAINAERIKCGEGIHAYAQDESFEIIPADKSDVQNKVIDAYMKLSKRYPISEICCVVPIRKKGKSQTASETLNEIIREKINPLTPDHVVLNNCSFRKGDRIMQTGVNDYKKNVFNGDCGIVSEVDAEESKIYVAMDDGRTIAFDPCEMTNFTFAYAMTIHKSQGSEYRAVIVVQSWEHYYMLQRNLLYTAVTRAKDKVILIGEAKAVNVAARTVKSQNRNTQLRNRIGKEVSF